MSLLKMKRVPVLLLTLCVAVAPSLAWGKTANQPNQRAHVSKAIDETHKLFVLPAPDAIRPRKVPRLQNSYCGNLAEDIGGGVANVGAQIIALLAVVGWCSGTVAGADELMRGDLEQGLIITTVATGLGALVGWGAGYGLAINNQVPENERPLWELAGATIGASSSIAVALGALGIRILLNPPAWQEPAERGAETPRRRQRPKPRSR